jgi:hypothetical protein
MCINTLHKGYSDDDDDNNNNNNHSLDPYSKFYYTTIFQVFLLTDQWNVRSMNHRQFILSLCFILWWLLATLRAEISTSVIVSTNCFGYRISRTQWRWESLTHLWERGIIFSHCSHYSSLRPFRVTMVSCGLWFQRNVARWFGYRLRTATLM